MKKSNFKIAILMDDSPSDGFISEHGFSVFIEKGEDAILFDTGQSGSFISNADKLGIDLRSVDKVVISHGHYDHIGGLKSFLELNGRAKIYLKKEALFRKLKLKNGDFLEIGNPNDLSEYLPRLVFVRNTVELAEGIFITDKIDDYGFGIHNKYMFTERGGKIAEDNFHDEIFLFIRNENWIFVLSGCSHRGIVNIVRSAVDLSGRNHISGILGGFHMNNESLDNIKREIGALKETDIDLIAPCHCTGNVAIKLVKSYFEKEYFCVKSGSVLSV